MLLCEYGCGQKARYTIKSGKHICSKSHNQCPTKRKSSAKGRAYVPENIITIELCSFGCNQPANYKHKNGKLSCSYRIQACPSVSETISETKLSSEGPKLYSGQELCSYGCNQTANYVFENGYLCCSDNAGKCKGILDKKWSYFEDTYGVRNLMSIEEVKTRQISERDKTMLERYGVINPIHIEGMDQKLKEIFLEKYGVHSPLDLIDQSRYKEQN